MVEDEHSIAEFLRVGLSYEGFEVETAPDGRRGLRMATEEKFILVILDLMLPGIDGFEVCRRIRESGDEVPIIMLTARTGIPDRVEGLTIGADDYVTKPFSFEELLARIQAVLRRKGLELSRSRTLSGANLTLDPDSHEVYRGDLRLELTRTEFSLLELLMSHPNRVFTRETLVNRVWGFDYYGDTNVVDVHISHLRRKIGDRSGERRAVQTVYGIGYTFRPDETDGESPKK